MLSLLKHWEVEEEWCYEDVVKEGVQWLMNNQREDGGRGKSRKNEDESLNLEKSCYAMMALLRHCEIAGDEEEDDEGARIKYYFRTRPPPLHNRTLITR